MFTHELISKFSYLHFSGFVRVVTAMDGLNGGRRSLRATPPFTASL
jgi:hypothetical protein